MPTDGTTVPFNRHPLSLGRQQPGPNAPKPNNPTQALEQACQILGLVATGALPTDGPALPTHLYNESDASLSREDESVLAYHYQTYGSIRARNRLAMGIDRFACRQARRFKNGVGRSAELDLLIQAARLGVLRAAQDFDPSRGFRFITYAAPWILHKLQRLVFSENPVTQFPVPGAPMQVKEKADRAGRIP